MSSEDPGPTLEQAPPPAPPEAPSAPRAFAANPQFNRMLLIAGAVIVVLLLGGYLMARGPQLFGGGKAEQVVNVEPFTPPTHMVTARDRVEAYQKPDDTSPAVVMFGQGVALNINGRVPRGIGGEWYQISWHDQTAYVKVADAVAGEEAPPGIEERPDEPQVIEPKPPQEENPFEQDFPDVAEEQPSGPFQIRDYEWIRAPNARDFARFYPNRALDDGRSGRVVLDCVADGGGHLDCSVAEENPKGYGFGRAALSIAAQTRIQPTTSDGRSVAGGHLRLPLNFRAG